MPGQIYISTMQIMTMIVHSVAALAFSHPQKRDASFECAVA
jgi:hypothetical protein